jgi:predicted DNA-binding protein (MmcQ/YjbR family)
MSLRDPRDFAVFVASLPGTSTVDQWGSRVAKVGGKVFGLIGLDSRHVAFKVSETSFAGLSEMQGIGQAPYFAKGQWVSVEPHALDDATLAEYLKESHRLIAAKLTRRARAELGL